MIYCFSCSKDRSNLKSVLIGGFSDYHRAKNAEKQENADKELKKKGKKTTECQDLRHVPKSEHIFMKLPKKGSFNLNSVMDSTYFFS